MSIITLSLPPPSSRFGNVMILGSPPWSPTSLEFTHGFPRKLVDDDHGGFLPGNVILTAQATNRCLRRLAVCDVACLVSRLSVEGVGLSYSSLLNLRYAAMSYRGGSYIPNYLTRGMLDTGVSFATFDALDVDTLCALRESLKDSWTLDADDLGSDQEWEGMVAKDALSAEILKDMGVSEEEGGEEEDEPARECRLTSFLCRAVCGPENPSTLDEVGSETGEEAGGELPQTGRDAAKRKGRKRQSGVGSSSSAGRRGQPQSSTSAGETAETAAQLATGQGAAVVDPFALNRLEMLGLKKDVFPSGASATSLIRFLKKHLPVSKAVSRRSFKLSVKFFVNDVLQYFFCKSPTRRGNVHFNHVQLKFSFVSDLSP